MAIQFVPSPGMVLMCDFGPPPSDVPPGGVTKGPLSVPPEMVKHRHVVVVSPRYRRHAGLCLVVPLSTQPPVPMEPHHFQIPSNRYQFFRADTKIWVKADLLSSVSTARLDRVLVQGRWQSPSLGHEDFQGVRQAILHALGLGHLTLDP